MADKPGVPSCLGIITDVATREDFAQQTGNARRGDARGYTWADEQIALANERKRRFDLHVTRNLINQSLARTHKKSVQRGAEAILARDTFESVSNVSLETRGATVEGKLHSIMAGFLEKFRPTRLGFARDPEGVRNVVRAIYGDVTGDQDAEYWANAWTQMTEYVRKRMNANGASIAKLQRWGMPQYNNPLAVGQAGVDKWMDDLLPKLDFERMVNESGLTDAELIKYLREQVYHNIATDGAHKIDLTAVTGKRQGKNLVNRYQQHRFLHFKSGDDWIAYQETYGSPDLLSTMNAWMHRVSMDIAAMEVLGPEPTVGLQHLKNLTAKADPLRQRVNTERLDKLYDSIMNVNGTVNPRLADIMQKTRDFNVAAHLGGATLSAITDPGFMAWTARINEIPFFKTLMRQIHMMVGDAEGREFASQIGLVAEYAADRAIAMNRFSMQRGTGWTARLADMTMRASLLNNLTVSARAAFQMEYMAQLAREAKKSWTELSPRRKDSFRRVGITQADWDKIRRSKKSVLRGTKFLDVNNMRNSNLSAKVTGLIYEESNYAIPVPDALTRVQMTQGLAKGTIGGETFRSVMQFKSFPVSMWLAHARRAQHTQAMNRGMYAAGMVVTLTGLGMLATQAKEIARGRDSIPLETPRGEPNWKFLARSMVQGGSFGLYGDFLMQDVNRYGYSAVESAGGPTLSLANDFIKLTAGNAFAPMYGEEMNLGPDALRLMKLYVPEVWYTKAAQDRFINEYISGILDPDWKIKAKRKQNKLRRETGQQLWWEDVEQTPSRAPVIVR